jgi:crotonobetainyl-CoA:carnitine CoA-transferase CaiB-like acyl-CoA transferase
VTGPAAKLSRTPLAVRRPAPALGADGEAILREIGIDEASRRSLVAAGVVALPRADLDTDGPSTDGTDPD